MTEEQRERFIRESAGKTIQSAEWVEDGAYWVFTFTDESEVSFRLMADLSSGSLAWSVNQRGGPVLTPAEQSTNCSRCGAYFKGRDFISPLLEKTKVTRSAMNPTLCVACAIAAG